VLWEVVEEGAKAKRSLWMTLCCVWACRVRLKADGRRAKRSRATPRGVVEAAQRVEGEDVVCRLSLVSSEGRGLWVRADEGRSRFMQSAVQQQKVISGLQRW
jgi:hypothetical protein